VGGGGGGKKTNKKAKENQELYLGGVGRGGGVVPLGRKCEEGKGMIKRSTTERAWITQKIEVEALLLRLRKDLPRPRKAKGHSVHGRGEA